MNINQAEKLKTCNYLTDGGCYDKKTKVTKRCAVKQKLKFKDYENCLVVNQLDNKKKTCLEKLY